MIGPSDIKKKAERRYIDYLRSVVGGQPIFPLDITFAKIKPGEAVRRWVELRRELVCLRDESAETRIAASYSIEWEERRDKLAGTQSLPQRIFFPTEVSYLSFIGKKKEVARFRQDCQDIVHAFPELAAWISEYPRRVIDYAGFWPRIMATIRWFVDNPSSGLYLREVPAVEDTKFIESYKSIIREVLDRVAARNTANTETFETRCGLKAIAPIIRVRILDRAIAQEHLSGVDDLAIPADRLDALGFDDIERVLVIENKASFSNADVFLTAPLLRNTIAIFGSGYAAASVHSAGWLATRRVFYWGDIDSHGLRILAAFRSSFPHTTSILMDDDTFERFPEYRSDAPGDFRAEPQGLTDAELLLFRKLCSLENRNRLEQERIPLAFVRAMLETSIQG
ncbi:MAG: DUF2220 family protein [Spirochaetia bacterium]|jgi:hypothetical protein|nr:DUF2220 family protein [Spirochaetia bacterium]